MMQYNFIIILGLLLLHCSLILAGNKRCEVLYEDTCILSDGSALKNDEQCVSGDGYLYKGVDDFGKCEYVKYIGLSDIDDNDEIYKILRSIGSVDSLDSLSSIDGVVDDSSCETTATSNCKKNKYYLFKNEDGTSSETGTVEGFLYYCDNNRSCTAVTDIGYYVNDKDTVFTCKTASTKVKCQKISSIKTSCTATTIGEVFVNGNWISLCLNYNQNAYTVVLINNAGNHLINYKDGNIFGISSGKYAVVKVEKQSVTLNKTYKNPKKFLYAYGDKSSNVVLENDAVSQSGDYCPSGENNLMELDCVDGICTETTE